MTDKLYHLIDRLAIWPVVAILVVILLISNQSFAGRREVLGEQVQVLDGRRWYNPLEVQQLFTKLGTDRYFYAITELTLDLLYPITYGLLLAVLIVRTWSPRYEWLVLFPFFTMVADLLENVTIAYMAFTFNGSATPLAWFAAVCTLLKSVLFLASLLILLNGGVVALLTQPRRY